MTESNKSPKNLRLRQQEAIDLLALGRTDAEVAEQVDATRITVTEWRLYHPEFVAALNRKREEVRGAAVREPSATENPSDAPPLPPQYPSESIEDSGTSYGVSGGGVSGTR